MRIGDDCNFIRLERSTANPGSGRGVGDVALTVEVQSSGFRGRDDEVWFLRDRIDQFLRELRSLEQRRDGSAVLTDMSCGSAYDGFRMEICSVSNLGQLAARVDLARGSRTSGELRRHSVSAGLRIDSERVITMVSDFEKLFD